MVLAAKRQTAAKTKAVPAAAKTAKPDEPTEQGAHDQQAAGGSDAVNTDPDAGGTGRGDDQAEEPAKNTESAKLELQTAAKSASLVVGAVLKRKFVNVSNPAKSDVLPVDEFAKHATNSSCSTAST